MSKGLIQSVPENGFKGLGRLRTLLLNGNMLRNVANFTFLDLVNLELLNLSSQPIESIEQNAFQGLIHLQTLDLSFCYMKTFDVYTYSNMLGLDTLHLYGNFLHSLHIPENDSVSFSFSLVHLDSYICCWEQFKCSVNQTLLHLCPNGFTSMKKSSYLLYGSVILTGHVFLMIYMYTKAISVSNVLFLVLSCIADGCQGLYILMVMIKDDLYETGMLHGHGGMKHTWCLTAATIQQFSFSLPLLLKAVQSREMQVSICEFVVGNTGRRKTKVVVVYLIAILFSMYPVLLNLAVNQEIGDATSRCSYFYQTGQGSSEWAASVLLIMNIIHNLAVVITVWACFKVALIKTKLARELGNKDIANQVIRILRPCFRATFSSMVTIIVTSVSYNLYHSSQTDVKWAYRGEWMMLMYSLPASLQLLLHIYFDLYRRIK